MIGKTLDNYRILGIIGEGGMGTVYRGIDTLLEREVAIKSLRAELAHDERLIARFRAEAVALARLNHPNIVTLYNFFVHEGQFFMVLEYVRGQTLEKRIAYQGTILWDEAVSLACQTLDGLEHAHQLKVIHRDIKPANLMLTTTGTLKVMDFGIARMLEKSRLTKTGLTLGTFAYMSPEQVQGQEADARSDLYALGIVLYEMLTGYIPFNHDSMYEMLRLQVQASPMPPRSWVPDLPVSLENVILRALAKAPDQRFQNAAEFRTALQKVVATEPAPAHDQSMVLMPLAAPPDEAVVASQDSAGLLPVTEPYVETSDSRNLLPVTECYAEQLPATRVRQSHLSGMGWRLLVFGVAGIVAIVTAALSLYYTQLPTSPPADPVQQVAPAISAQQPVSAKPVTPVAMVIDDDWLKELLEPWEFDLMTRLIPPVTGLHPALTANRMAPERDKTGVKPAETTATTVPAKRLPDDKARAAVTRPKVRTERQEAPAARATAPKKTEPPRKPAVIREPPSESGWQIRK